MYATSLGLNHRSGAELRQLYQTLVIENETYDKKGEFLKKCSWYSIVKLADRHDKVWHVRRWQAERVAELLTGNRGKQIATHLVTAMQNPGGTAVTADPGVANANHGDAMTTKETCLAEMRALRKRVGNCLLLAPLLLHDRNLLNSRIMLLVGRVAWTEQTWWSSYKTTSFRDKQMSALNSTGYREETVMKIWVNATHHSSELAELARLGIAVKEGQECLDLDASIGRGEPVTTLMSFLLHFM